MDNKNDTVWATEQQIMELFCKARRTIGEHIKNIYKEGELDKESTWREFRQVQKEGKQKVTRKIDDNALVALALAVAQSIPEQRELIIKQIINLIKINPNKK